MDIDEAFAAIGQFGPHQKRLFVLLALQKIFLGCQMVLSVFLAVQENFSCFMLSINETVYNQCPDTGQCDRYDFEKSDFYSIVNEFQLVCNQYYKSVLIQSLFMIGVMIGTAIFGTLSDYYGRLPAYYIASVGLVVCGLSTPMTTTYGAFLLGRMTTGACTGGVSLVNFVLILELVGQDYRTFCGNVFLGIFAMGVTVLSAIAYVSTSWRALCLFTSIPSALLLFASTFMIHESPRWLFTQGRVGAAERIMTQIARGNGLAISATTSIQLRELVLCKHDSDKSIKFFKVGVLRNRILVQVYGWFVLSTAYYGITLEGGQFGINRFLAFALSGIAEIPGLIIAHHSMNKFGRKNTLCGFSFITAIICFSMPLIPYKMGLILFLMSTIAKISISAAYATAYIYSAELFPTIVRNNGMAICSVAGRIGGALAPFTLPLGQYFPELNFILYAIMLLTTCLTNISLPETKDDPLPETISDLFLEKKKRQLTGATTVDLPHSNSPDALYNRLPFATATDHVIDYNNFDRLLKMHDEKHQLIKSSKSYP